MAEYTARKKLCISIKIERIEIVTSEYPNKNLFKYTQSSKSIH